MMVGWIFCWTKITSGRAGSVFGFMTSHQRTHDDFMALNRAAASVQQPRHSYSSYQGILFKREHDLFFNLSRSATFLKHWTETGVLKFYLSASTENVASWAVTHFYYIHLLGIFPDFSEDEANKDVNPEAWGKTMGDTVLLPALRNWYRMKANVYSSHIEGATFLMCTKIHIHRKIHFNNK